MTLSEFKAWFDGFSEGVGEAPTPEQWAKIKAKIATLSAGAVLGIRDADQFKRTWAESPPRYGQITSGADAGEFARNHATTHRVRDLVTGADLGPAD